MSPSFHPDDFRRAAHSWLMGTLSLSLLGDLWPQGKAPHARPYHKGRSDF